jgi:hypothetical protein
MGVCDEIAWLQSEPPGNLKNLLRNIDPQWVEDALAATGKALLRRRRLPAEQVIWLVIGMALYRDKSITEVADSLDIALPGRRGPTVAPSAIPKARARVGPDPLKWLVELTGRRWAHSIAGDHLWNGLRIYAMDGTTFRLEDTPTNREHFGAGMSRLESARPLARLVVLVAAHARVVVTARLGPYSTGEQTLSEDLWNEIPENSVMIVDRAYHNAAVMLPYAAKTGRHWLMRAKSTTKWKVIERLGANDHIVEMETSSAAQKKAPGIPKTYRVRAIGYQRPGFRNETLLTSMLDHVAYPATEVIDLYHSRWEIENAYDEIKTEMLNREEALRSKSPSSVEQEVWGLVLAYNLIRVEMARIAKEAVVHPRRISFVTAYSLIRTEWLWSASASPGAIPRHLQNLRADIRRFILPERRSDRAYPRTVKSRGLKYPRRASPVQEK